jgi:hypothetical protein
VLATHALSVGHALDLGWASAGVVHSVFARAVNLEMRASLWTLLSPERADLPLGIRVALTGFDGLGLRRGDRVHVRSGFLGIGSPTTRLVVDCRAAPRWIPACPARRAPGLRERLRMVASAASDRAWHGSARMAYAVVNALEHRDALSDALAAVVGCGPGCTPAGDDVLVGILALLKSPHSGAAEPADALRRSLLPLLPTTTDISGHLLRQAADGLFGRTVHDLVAALIGGCAPEHLRQAVQRVVAAGATSGADLCVGMLACAPSVLLSHDERAAA